MIITGVEFWLWLLAGFILMAIPTVQFREFDISETEPGDRTTAGSVVDGSTPLDFGTANNTAGSVQVGPACVIFRCSNLQGNSSISNMRFWLSSNSSLVGTNKYYCDITGTWTQNKTVSQVAAGIPGVISAGIPSANVQKNDGGNITGTGHADTSQYIYIALEIGQDETIGVKDGASSGFAYSLKFDYS